MRLRYAVVIVEHDRVSAEGPVGWGIIGCGSIAMHAVAPGIGWSKNGKLVAIASRDTATAREKARALGVARVYSPYEALLGDDDVEAVYIGTPNGLHEEWAMRAGEAKKHVLCEKSLTLSLSSARRLTAFFREKKLRLVEAYMYRHHPQWNVVRTLLAEAAIGQPRLLRATFSGPLRNDDDHRWSASLGGGALHDVVCYAVDVARYVLGSEPVRVSAFSDTGTPEEVDVSTGALLEFPGPILATAAGSLRAASEQELVITGSEGCIEVLRPFVPGWGATTIVHRRDDSERRIEIGGANHFLHQVEHFARLVREPDVPSAPAEDGLANAVVLDAIARSHRTGLSIDL